jgi:hypothetical protein
LGGVYLRDLLSAAERKNGWTLSDRPGDRTLHAMQRLLKHADWIADAVRDDSRDYVWQQVRRGGPAVAPAPPDGSRIARSGSLWPMPPSRRTCQQLHNVEVQVQSADGGVLDPLDAADLA